MNSRPFFWGKNSARITEFLHASVADNSARINLQMSQAAENIQEFVSSVLRLRLQRYRFYKLQMIPNLTPSIVLCCLA
jgi:hypothetical protein